MESVDGKMQNDGGEPPRSLTHFGRCLAPSKTAGAYPKSCLLGSPGRKLSGLSFGVVRTRHRGVHTRHLADEVDHNADYRLLAYFEN